MMLTPLSLTLRGTERMSSRENFNLTLRNPSSDNKIITQRSSCLSQRNLASPKQQSALQMRAKLQNLDEKVSTLHSETNQCNTITYRASKDMKNLKDQLVVVKEGIS